MVSHCACPTRVFPGRALHEHRRPAAYLVSLFTPTSFNKGVARLSFTARIEGAPFHRGASASKKNGLASPLHPFQARYILRHPWTGPDDCPAVTAYRQQLRDRYEREAQTLATLTGWNIDDIRRTMNIETASASIEKRWYQRLWSN